MVSEAITYLEAAYSNIPLIAKTKANDVEHDGRKREKTNCGRLRFAAE